MTETGTQTADAPETQPPAPHHGPIISRPLTDAAALRAIDRVKSEMHERAAAIRRDPVGHEPKLVLSEHVRGTSLLDKIADAVNRICGSMWVFIAITVGIVVWLFLGNIVGFDKTPWPLLLTILNLPQLSIMISLQVSANRAQAASDRRALADHETLISLHEMGKLQLDILNSQNKVLAILDGFASKDMPAKQQEIEDTVIKIFGIVSAGTR
jgi:uncharacterized membrane protein